MKRKIAQVLGAVLLVTTLSSCYVYDDPVAWRGGYSAPVYRPGYTYRSYGYPSRSYGYPSRSYHRGHSHGGHSSGHHHGHHHSSRSHHGHHHR